MAAEGVEGEGRGRPGRRVDLDEPVGEVVVYVVIAVVASGAAAGPDPGEALCW
ncbi:MAG: hypothetical protein L0227_11695 [Chloroflexi bacterium]|nr:hypothetical protein [Chloroflexota bacterium]